MANDDNWGWQARVGMFIVASEAVPEAEWWAMAPPGVSVHASRIEAGAPWATIQDGQVELAADLARGIRHFASMRLDSVVVGHSSSSILGGAGWDEAVAAQLKAALPEATKVTTNGLDTAAALRSSGVERPYLVFPPWFNPALAAKGTDYFESQGFTPAGALQADPGRGWRDLDPGELYSNGLGFEQDVESLYRQVRDGCPDSADGVLIAGTGFRCVGIIDALERDLGRPVITANQASLWHSLTLAGIQPDIQGYGNLLRAIRRPFD
jgi:maleate isomerase